MTDEPDDKPIDWAALADTLKDRAAVFERESADLARRARAVASNAREGILSFGMLPDQLAYRAGNARDAAADIVDAARALERAFRHARRQQESKP